MFILYTVSCVYICVMENTDNWRLYFEKGLRRCVLESDCFPMASSMVKSFLIWELGKAGRITPQFILHPARTLCSRSTTNHHPFRRSVIIRPFLASMCRRRAAAAVAEVYHLVAGRLPPVWAHQLSAPPSRCSCSDWGGGGGGRSTEARVSRMWQGVPRCLVAVRSHATPPGPDHVSHMWPRELAPPGPHHPHAARAWGQLVATATVPSGWWWWTGKLRRLRSARRTITADAP